MGETSLEGEDWCVCSGYNEGVIFYPSLAPFTCPLPPSPPGLQMLKYKHEDGGVSAKPLESFESRKS